MRERLFLVGQGVDFDIAFTLSEIECTAWCIIFSEQNGAEFDWRLMRFKEQK